MIARLLAWLSDPARWAGADGIPTRLLEHLVYSVVVVLLAAAVAVPVGLLIGHTGRGKWVVTSANAARAIPSLGLLFAVALVLGPRLSSDLAFVLPSLLVLVVLAMPPLLSGAYSGVEAVDPAARDAAYGIGMTGRQVLTGVELPCALPLVLSGVRSATLQVVATATIASFISLGGLGRYLVDGLASGDYAQMAGGALLVATLALLLDGILALVQRRVVSPGLRLDAHPARSRRSRRSADATDTTSTAADTAGVAPASAPAASTPSSSPAERSTP
ncbi:ABC transporter permease [Mobilicoccus pelagius]|uniref:Putative ABC transporter permease protein n=1 Tax=Mobilicoccus pelagius NBRC 104925 TaxID=1089455 RepID=H5UW46_9MICO|nr:ABC transporter permease subunit [Mobilicoccus pelagius]GAB49954.1 putative ABC transporter permease protein [Mobilicoccus pelagius NBRC 104925]